MVLMTFVALVLEPSSALADGDPASDVLAAQSLFLPQDASTSAGQSERLAAALAAGARRAPLRVAVIASASDLGAVTALWRRPEDYARFLGQEVSLLYRGEILVVMPAGYGLARDGHTPPRDDLALLDRLPVPGRALGAAALSAGLQLLGAHGIATPAAAAALDPQSPENGATLAWLVFGFGAALIAGTWAYSVRVRPLTGARRPVS